jgi:hypothetical protein
LPVKAFEVLLKKINMKKILLALLFSSFLLNQLAAQEDEALAKRVKEILIYTQEKNTEKILDYTYPKLFTILTRSQMKEALAGIYDTDEFTAELDSLFIIKIYPVFTVEGNQYCKIMHNMVMYMKFKEVVDTVGKDSEANSMVELMGLNYGKENVRFDAKNNSLVIKMTPDMIAVKENNTWYFSNYDEDNPAMIDLLFSKAVQKKYKEFQ